MENAVKVVVANFATVRKEQHIFQLLRILQQLRRVETVKLGC